MRMLVCHPGASYATHDVFVGLYHALVAQGHTLYAYQLDSRIERAGSWLMHCWRKAGKPDPRPTTADILYRASVEALERALRFDVDHVLVVSGMYVHPNVFLLMRRAGLRIGVVFTESPYDDSQQFQIAQMVDVCWTNERSSVRMLRLANPNTYYLPPGYNADQHAAIVDLEDDVPAHDVVFVGTAFKERIDALAAVDWTGIDLGLYGEWRGLPSRHRLRQYLRGGVTDNRVALELYRRSKVGLNLFRQSKGFDWDSPRITYAESMNPRIYDLAAAGAFQMTDHRAEVTEVFDSSVPTFGSVDELEPMLRKYLSNPSAREACTVEARRRVAPHTYAARAAQLVSQWQDTLTLTHAKGA
jgi:spore maturation protein CgeB